MKFKSNPKLMVTLTRVQSRFRSLIVRNKVKSSLSTKYMMPNDPYGQYVVINSSKIV